MNDKTLTEDDCKAMSIEELMPVYTAACAEWKRVDATVNLTRGVLHAKQEIATAKALLVAVEGKHATNAGTGGGL